MDLTTFLLFLARLGSPAVRFFNWLRSRIKRREFPTIPPSSREISKALKIFLLHDDVRVVALIGPGGCGKSSLLQHLDLGKDGNRKRHIFNVNLSYHTTGTEILSRIRSTKPLCDVCILDHLERVAWEEGDSPYHILRKNLEGNPEIPYKILVSVNDGTGVADFNSFRESLGLAERSRLKVVEMSLVPFAEAMSLLKEKLPFLNDFRAEKILHSLQQESGGDYFFPADLSVLTSTLVSRPQGERKLAIRSDDEIGLIRTCYLEYLDKKLKLISAAYHKDIWNCLNLLANNTSPLSRQDLIAATSSGDKKSFSTWFPTIEDILRQVGRPGDGALYVIPSAAMRESIKRRSSVPMDTLAAKYELWKRDEDPDFLLKSSELSLVRQSIEDFKAKAPGSDRFLKASQNNQRLRVVKATSVVVVALMFTLIIGFWLMYFRGRGTGIPAGMSEASKRVKKIRVGDGVHDMTWLPKGLESLDVSGTSQVEMFADAKSLEELNLNYSSIPIQEDLSGAPRGLRRLSMLGIPVMSLRNPPPNLEMLEILGSQLSEFRGAPSSLRELLVYGALPGLQFADLPDGLHKLTITASPSISSIEKLPDNIASLTLDGINLDSLPYLPNRLQELAIFNNRNPRFAVRKLPANLISFKARGVSLAPDLAWPVGLRELELDRLPEGDLPPVERLKLTLTAYDDRAVANLKIPESVRDLDISAQTSLIKVRLPEKLIRLALDWVGDEFSKFRLPVNLKVLEVRNLSRIDRFIIWPENLEELLLFGDFAEIDELPQHLKSIRISSRSIREFPKLPDALEQLDVSECVSLKEIQLPGKLLVLRMGKVPLPIRDWPPTLLSLDIVKTPIENIRNWPEGLNRLHFGEGQLTEIRGAPDSLAEVSISSEIDPWRFPEPREELRARQGSLGAPRP